MKTERESFNEWLKYYEKHDVVIDQLQRAFMWQAWQASANRDGYKLVPVEPTQEMIDNGWNQCSGDEDVRMIYKSMVRGAP